MALCVPVNVLGANPDQLAKAQVRNSCHSCHGYDGVAQTESWPNLACQNRGYLYSRLLHFKRNGEHDIDKTVKQLSAEEVAQLAKHYADMPCVRSH